MFKKKRPSITSKMNVKVREIMKQGEETSLEAKKLEFCNFLDEYYHKYSGNSDLLVVRREEIKFYATTSKDILLSFIISITTSFIISSIFEFLDEYESSISDLHDASIIVRAFFLVLMVLLVVALLVTLLVIVVRTHNERKELSEYEKLNVKDYEIKLIDEILDRRYDDFKAKNGSKNKKTVKSFVSK